MRGRGTTVAYFIVLLLAGGLSTLCWLLGHLNVARVILLIGLILFLAHYICLAMFRNTDRKNEESKQQK